MKRKYDIFISYRRLGGKEYARTIKPELEKRGFRVFLDFDELDDGVFDRRIMDAISEAPVFLLILSQGVLDRCKNAGDWVREEILYAYQKNRHIVPVEFDKTFRRIPSDTPKDISAIIEAHSWAQIDTETLLQESVDKMVRKRIKPHIDSLSDEHSISTISKVVPQAGIEVHVETEDDCELYCFHKHISTIYANEDNIIHLPPGTYKLEFVSIEDSKCTHSLVYSVPADVSVGFIEVTSVDLGLEMHGQSDSQKQYELGDDYYNGQNGKQKNYAEAFKWYLKAAEQDNAYAQNQVAFCYQCGIGVKQDYTEAAKWFRKAAELGLSVSQTNLASCYEYGDGVLQNYSDAIYWYRKAAESGEINAQKRLGALYEEGTIVQQNLYEAIKWYRMAANQGDTTAADFLKMLQEEIK